eukprot:NODE_5508_length_576_cov_146.589251.p1 GENE.NODE_5508_length_576_cov_146.589251~~NODE_5508_length_576_cov_146.589251.p1  ORF type:complete len:141 (+),score=24.61 NODE_5508_length_576_cov_146.589251:3-425(+)
MGISHEELSVNIHCAEVQRIFFELGIEVSDATELYHLVDCGSIGEVSIEAFVAALLRLTGGQRHANVDNTMMIYQNWKLLSMLEQQRETQRCDFHYVTSRLPREQLHTAPAAPRPAQPVPSTHPPFTSDAFTSEVVRTWA